jgi:hypothetical protein
VIKSHAAAVACSNQKPALARAQGDCHESTASTPMNASDAGIAGKQRHRKRENRAWQCLWVVLALLACSACLGASASNGTCSTAAFSGLDISTPGLLLDTTAGFTNPDPGNNGASASQSGLGNPFSAGTPTDGVVIGADAISEGQDDAVRLVLSLS